MASGCELSGPVYSQEGLKAVRCTGGGPPIEGIRPVQVPPGHVVLAHIRLDLPGALTTLGAEGDPDALGWRAVDFLDKADIIAALTHRDSSLGLLSSMNGRKP